MPARPLPPAHLSQDALWVLGVPGPRQSPHLYLQRPAAEPCASASPLNSPASLTPASHVPRHPCGPSPDLTLSCLLAVGEGLTAPPSLVCPDAHPTLLRLRCPAPRPSLSTHPSSTRVTTCSQPVVPSPLPIRQLPPPELRVKRPRDRAGAPAGAVPVERGPLRPRTPRPVRPHPPRLPPQEDLAAGPRAITSAEPVGKVTPQSLAPARVARPLCPGPFSQHRCGSKTSLDANASAGPVARRVQVAPEARAAGRGLEGLAA